MRQLFNIALFCMAILFVACEKEDNRIHSETDSEEHNTSQCTDECAVTNNKIFEENGQLWLWGGENKDWHFNIGNFSLSHQGLKSGLGREFFPALIEPEYVPLENLSHHYSDHDEFIVVHGDDVIKAFSLNQMVLHEVINDVIDDLPIMVTYCVLADFIAVYTRDYCGHTFTFALSGYTYHEEGVYQDKDGFVLWDRDTESLWWPLRGSAVSGSMFGKSLKQTSLGWERVTLDYLLSEYEDVLMLDHSQTMAPPESWEEFDAELCN